MINSLIIIQNKKLNNGQKIYEQIVPQFSSAGYYFNIISIIDFDVKNLDYNLSYECDNIIIACDKAILSLVKNKLIATYGNKIGIDGQFISGNKYVFVITNENQNYNVKDVVDSLNRRYSVKYDKLYIKMVGATNEKVQAAIALARESYAEFDCNIYAEYGECTIEIVYSSLTPKMYVDDVLRILVSQLDEFIYALEDVSLAQRLYQALTLRRMKICVTESFTGGGISQKLVEIPGVSAVYMEGITAYSNQSKMNRLGVNDFTLKQFGAVSDEVAYQMARGLIATGNCDISIATTGIAGPHSDMTQKPVGLCYIAIGKKDEVLVYKYVLKGDRQTITKTAINFALFLAYKQIK